MADDNLLDPVELKGGRIDSVSFPPGSPMPFIEATVNRSDDVKKVADKAQQAAEGAHDAQQKNDEQDVILANHEVRIGTLEVKVEDHEVRITANTNAIAALDVRLTTSEGKIVVLRTDVDAQGVRLTAAEGNITAIDSRVSSVEADVAVIKPNYISKAVSTSQSVQASGGSFLVGNIPSPTSDKLQVGGSENVSVSYKVAGLQVVSAQQTGWTASTGTALKGGINAATAYTVGAAYSQAEVQAIAAGLVEARRVIKALQDALAATTGHGLINA